MTVSAAHRAFVENCRDILSRQDDVRINDAAIEAYAGQLKSSGFIPDWKEYISAAANSRADYDFKRVFYEMAMVVANQGGFIYADADGCAQKWHLGGSGARAMVAKMAEIRAAGALLLDGVPFAEERLVIFEAFADAARYAQVAALLDDAYDGGPYVLDMAFAQRLAQAMPESFGNDPFLKKAILTVLMAAGNAHSHSIHADISDLTVAADYILPQVLNADHIGILSFSPVLEEKLSCRHLFRENAQEVTALRAAAVVACERLAELSGLTAREIDGHLWLAGRKLQNARPHMMCLTMQF